MAYATLASRAMISNTGFDISPYSSTQMEQIFSTLDSEAVSIASYGATEEPSNVDNYYSNTEDGVYVSRLTDIPVFDSRGKYDPKTGWPSFFELFDKQHVIQLLDADGERTEIREVRGNTHLGHVFNDGPPPAGVRFCINGHVLKFIPRKEFNDLHGTKYLQLQNKEEI